VLPLFRGGGVIRFDGAPHSLHSPSTGDVEDSVGVGSYHKPQRSRVARSDGQHSHPSRDRAAVRRADVGQMLGGVVLPLGYSLSSF
jgi:hypothetical protein